MQHQTEKCVADLKAMELSFNVAKLNRFGATLHRELVIKGKERTLVFSDQDKEVGICHWRLFQLKLLFVNDGYESMLFNYLLKQENIPRINTNHLPQN